MSPTPTQMCLEVPMDATRARVRLPRVPLRRAAGRLEAIASPMASASAAELSLVSELLERHEELGEEVHEGLLLGDAIAVLRARALIAVEAVSRRSGVSTRRCTAIERGDAASARELVALAQVYDVSAVGLAALPPGRTREVEHIGRGHTGQALLPGWPGATSWASSTWREDEAARAFVRRHPAGATAEEIALAMGVTSRSIERLEEAARRRLVATGLLEGLL